MSRKHYVAIANILKEYRQSMTARDYNDLVDDFAKHLAYDNQRFDVETFRKACAYNSPELLRVV